MDVFDVGFGRDGWRLDVAVVDICDPTNLTPKYVGAPCKRSPVPRCDLVFSDCTGVSNTGFTETCRVTYCSKGLLHRLLCWFSSQISDDEGMNFSRMALSKPPHGYISHVVSRGQIVKMPAISGLLLIGKLADKTTRRWPDKNNVRKCQAA